MVNIKPSRRDFFKISLYLGGLLFPGFSRAESSPSNHSALKIYGLGSGPSVLVLEKDNPNHNKGESVFFGFDGSNQFVDLNLPIKAGHSIERLQENELVCVPGRGEDGSLVIIDEKTNKIVRTVKLLKGYGASGHLYNDTKNQRLYIPVEKLKSKRNTYGGHGRLMIYNYQKNSVEQSIDLPELAPHQVKVLPRKGHIVVSFYGKQQLNKEDETYKHSYSGSQIVIFDSKSLKIIKKFETPGNGYVSHFCVDDSDRIYMPLINYANNNQNGRAEVKKRLNTSKEYLSLTPFEIMNDQISLPEPVIVLDTDTYKFKKINGIVPHQRGPQTIYYHKRTKEVFISYFVSDKLMNINTSTGRVRYVSAFDFGIENIRGIYGDTKNKEIYISGHNVGLAILDDSELRLKNKVNGYTYGAAHIFNAKEIG